MNTLENNSVIDMGFLDQMNHYQLLKEDYSSDTK
jgi:hypothetical protein